MADKWVYAFGGGTAEGRGDQKELLGGKGAGLAEMSRLGIPVPPGFTITTRACIAYQEAGRELPAGLAEEVAEHLARLEELQGRRFGDPANPLLVSVRSGAAQSMPGMMDTVLNLGLTRASVEARIAAGGEPHFRWDAYRRLLTMYGDVVLGVAHKEFERVLAAERKRQGVATDAELTAESLAAVCDEYEALIERHAGRPFPQDPEEQLWGGIRAVFDSWDNQRARDYRRLHGLPDDMGTGVNVQAMVFGNRGDDCATGVAFTRSPATGEPGIYGEFLVNAQGEDVVAGIRTPQPIEPRDGSGGGLAELFPEAAGDLAAVCEKLEAHYRDMQDVEFTIEGGKLYMLQTRTGKRTGLASFRIVGDDLAAGELDEREALRRIEPTSVEQVMAPIFDAEAKRRALDEGRLLARGLPAGPGAASGRIALSAERAAAMAAHGPVLLVREETSPEDIVGMHAAAGILTARGGMTSHAAVVARGLGKPCIVGAGDLHVDEEAGEVRVAGRSFREGEELSIDGTGGEVIAGRLATRPSEIVAALTEGGQATPLVEVFRRVLSRADGERRLRVRANADTPEDARRARAFGAEGIGLCRTEHMFFAEERIALVRRMILAQDADERAEPLARLLPQQQGDFAGIFAAMDGLPVTVRLLDPPLHEFLPHGERALEGLARDMGIEPAAVADRAAGLAETNPMLGHRGCRLGLTAPDIYAMQVEAIVRAAAARKKAGGDPRPEIMVPLVGAETEMVRLREGIAEVVSRVLAEEGVEIAIPVGTMIEVPRAVLAAGAIARHADFFSFGTNDLTQMTFGFSRDDVGSFLPRYLEEGILPKDPFASLDVDGVGQLVRLACERGRTERPDLHLGVCGEHGGDPASIAFFDRVGLDYVSCSPFRVPVARLAAARAAMGRGEREMDSV
jgi:pyruvate, orthophosphate dikinase